MFSSLINSIIKQETLIKSEAFEETINQKIIYLEDSSLLNVKNFKFVLKKIIKDVSLSNNEGEVLENKSRGVYLTLYYYKYRNNLLICNVL